MWVLPVLKEVLANRHHFLTIGQHHWPAAIAALQQLLLQVDPEQNPGIIFTSPAPVFDHPDILDYLPVVIFTPEETNILGWMPFLLTGCDNSDSDSINQTQYNLPFLPGDPLEQFCLVFTEQFSLILVLDAPSQCLIFSFDPEDAQACWSALKPRILLSRPQYLPKIEQMVRQSVPVVPSYQVVSQFTQQLLNFTDRLARPQPIASSQPLPPQPPEPADMELLQAMAHEIRTPLSTIRTMTRLLLKRRDLPVEVSRRLEMIDAECSEQINRMELIFRAVELEKTPCKDQTMSLTTMPLTQILQNIIPRWQKQAEKYDLGLTVDIPPDLPNVVSNPAMLDQLLTGLVENSARTLPTGSQIQVAVSLAGEQLKIQVHYTSGEMAPAFPFAANLKSLGQLLMLQPETGSLSLNLHVTKNLFQALGGKLIVRHRPQQGEVMTIFLPLHF